MRTLIVLSTLALVAIQSPAAEKEAKARARFSALEVRLLDAVRGNDVGAIETLRSPDFAWSMALEGRPNVVENRSEWINGNQYYSLGSFDIGNLVAEEFGNHALVHFHLNVTGQIGKRTERERRVCGHGSLGAEGQGVEAAASPREPALGLPGTAIGRPRAMQPARPRRSIIRLGGVRWR